MKNVGVVNISRFEKKNLVWSAEKQKEAKK